MSRIASAAKESPATPNTTREELRRAAILKAARNLVAESGFGGTQMVSVAKEAGVALGTLYRYFPSKAALMVEVVAMVTQREIDVTASVASRNGRAAERLAAAVWTFASRALRGRNMAHALIVEPVELEIEMARIKYLHILERVFETIVEQGIRQKEFPSQDVQTAAACIVGCLRDGLVGPIAHDARASAKKRLEQVKSVVVFCVRGVSGRNEAFALPENATL